VRTCARACRESSGRSSASWQLLAVSFSGAPAHPTTPTPACNACNATPRRIRASRCGSITSAVCSDVSTSLILQLPAAVSTATTPSPSSPHTALAATSAVIALFSSALPPTATKRTRTFLLLSAPRAPSSPPPPPRTAASAPWHAISMPSRNRTLLSSPARCAVGESAEMMVMSTSVSAAPRAWPATTTCSPRLHGSSATRGAPRVWCDCVECRRAESSKASSEGARAQTSVLCSECVRHKGQECAASRSSGAAR